jgi:50S ribosomal protein L16 3-hydroxylase
MMAQGRGGPGCGARIGQNHAMDVNAPRALLGGLSPAAFMRRHWQKTPLLVRQAWPGVAPPVSRREMFALAASEDVESRLVVREPARWRVRPGPLPPRALPPLSRPGWTLLVQGLDLHQAAARAMLECFRFVPDARLDDLMLSWASPGGGVGPHIDSYDVFLLQVQGRRRWSVGPVADASFVEGEPLKLLRHFQPQQEWLLERGDMLYLPPLWGHDGVAEGGDCMTCSIGFRAPAAQELARALGESLTEPKPRVWFERQAPDACAGGVRLDARSRMMYDEGHVFLNGEAFAAGGRDARLMRQLADTRRLTAAERARLGAAAADFLVEWMASGWVHGEPA